MAAATSARRLLRLLLLTVILMQSSALISTAAAAAAAQATRDHHRRLEGSYTAHILHRDSPASPFRKESATERDVWLERLARDARRVRALGHIGGAGSTRGASIVSGYKLAGSGEYFARLGVGGNPSTRRELYMVMDTGSDLSWIQCTPCDSCYSQIDQPVFDPATSSTLRNVSCHSPLCTAIRCAPGITDSCPYEVTYGDGSSTVGNLVTDTFTLGNGNGGSLPNMVFGCGHRNEGDFVGSAGLLGLGSGPVSFPSQLHALMGRAQSTFSYCLPPMFAATTSALTFGNTPPPPKGATILYTPLLRNPNLGLQSFYYVSLTGISVAGARLPIPPALFQLDNRTGNGGLIVDSGTSVTRLPSTAYALFRSAFRKSAATTVGLRPTDGFAIFDTCFDVDHPSSHLPNGVPSVVLHFAGEGADLHLPATNVLVSIDQSGTSKQVCLAFAPNSDQGQPFSILGNIQQQGFRLSFDTRASKLGFMADQC